MTYNTDNIPEQCEDEVISSKLFYPDVLGMMTSQAIELLNEKNFLFNIREVSSYGKDKVEDGVSRIIRQINPSENLDGRIDFVEEILLVSARVRDIIL